MFEFTKGREEDILPKKIHLGHDHIEDMLESGYSIAKIGAMPGVQLEFDDTPLVKLVRPFFFFQLTIVLFNVVI